MKLANLVISSLLKQLRLNCKNDIILPNMYYKKHFECDLFQLKTSGYTHEFEVKITKADLRKDFAKRECSWDEKSLLKHDLILSGKRTNYFSFVFPKNFLEDEEIIKIIPKEYGIYFFEIKNNVIDYIVNFRPEKTLHKNKMSFEDKEILLKNIYYRYDSIRLNYIEVEGQDKRSLMHKVLQLESEIGLLKLKPAILTEQIETIITYLNKNGGNFRYDNFHNRFFNNEIPLRK